MIKIGDKVKIISQNVEGVVEDILTSKFFNHKTLKDEYSCCFVVKGKNTFYVSENDLELCEQEQDELTKYKRAFEILKEELNIELGKEEHTFKDFKDIYYYMSIKPDWQDTKITFELSQKEHALLEELMKMNKYQDALDNLLKFEREHNIKTFGNVVPHPNSDLLQELVDKETPMKSLNNGKMYKKGYRWQCPNCKGYLYEANSQTMRLISTQKQYTFCAECGQKLDWSDSNVEN